MVRRLKLIAADPKHLGAELHHPHLHCVVAGNCSFFSSLQSLRDRHTFLGHLAPTREVEWVVAILGEGASGLSATNIVRLKSSWETDYKAWSQRDLSPKRYVYWWADGVYFNVRLDRVA
jgi:hypothetical protein